MAGPNKSWGCTLDAREVSGAAAGRVGPPPTTTNPKNKKKTNDINKPNNPNQKKKKTKTPKIKIKKKKTNKPQTKPNKNLPNTIKKNPHKTQKNTTKTPKKKKTNQQKKNNKTKKKPKKPQKPKKAHRHPGPGRPCDHLRRSGLLFLLGPPNDGEKIGARSTGTNRGAAVGFVPPPKPWFHQNISTRAPRPRSLILPCAGIVGDTNCSRCFTTKKAHRGWT